jgi:hypothetical protein
VSPSRASVANAVKPAPETAGPEFRLNGIIYNEARPIAIVNGLTVRVGDEVNGATVISIERDRVTLSSNAQSKTLYSR